MGSDVIDRLFLAAALCFLILAVLLAIEGSYGWAIFQAVLGLIALCLVEPTLPRH